MRVLVQPRDIGILKLAKEGVSQEQIPWEASYQSKMRRLRKLCKAGLLEMKILHRQEPNRYFITEKGLRVLRWQQNPFNVKRGDQRE